MSEQEIDLGEDVSTMMTWGQYAPFFNQHVLFQFDFCSLFMVKYQKIISKTKKIPIRTKVPAAAKL